MMKKIFSFIGLLFAFQLSIAQQYQASLEAVKNNGLHKVILTPEMRSVMQNNIAHIRIYDSQNNEVPYLFFEGNSSESKREQFSLISKEAIKNESTTIVVLNEKLKNIDGLILEIANTDVTKKYNISGSNDNLQWFGLVNNQTVSNLNELGKTSVERFFTFPLNNYKYLKFEFIDKNSLPINVLNANLLIDSFKTKEQIKLTNFELKKINNQQKKQTKIVISFSNPQAINEIKFNIKAPNFYLREARILVEKTRKIKKHEEKYQEIVASFQLNSKKANQFNISNLFVSQFTIEIDNDDNPELKIDNIELFQNLESLIADFKTSDSYIILIDDNLKTPTYDLAQSGIDLNINYPIIATSNLEKNNSDKSIEKATAFWQTSSFMWICIILAVLILGYFSFSLLKDLNKNDKDNNE